MPTFRRGDVVEINLDLTLGHEQAKQRPCLVVQADSMNDTAWCTIILPITGQTPTVRQSPLAIAVGAGVGGLREDSFVLCNQVRCVDARRVIKILGSMPTSVMTKVAVGLKACLDLPMSSDETSEALKLTSN